MCERVFYLLLVVAEVFTGGHLVKLEQGEVKVTCARKVVISVHFPYVTPLLYSSGVGGVSASNLASMGPRRSTASGQHGLSGQTAQEPVEGESCTGNAPVPAPGNKRYSNFRCFSASQIH